MATTVVSSLPALRFADSFWDANDHGINVMLDKLYTAKQTSEEIKKLFEIRSQIEEDYGERLLKLSQTAVGQAEQRATLAESLAQIPNSFETSGRAHLDLAHQLKDHLEAPLDGFLREQRDLRRMHHQQIENARQLKNMHHTNAVKAKEFYHSECQRVSTIEKTIRELGSNMSADHRKKMESEITEGRKMIQVAETEYRRAVDVFNSVTQDWVASWKSTCNVFQEMEERRVRYIHSSLRSFASMLSSVCSVDEQCYDRINATLELTDVRRDMDDFSLRFGTATEVPGMIQFEPYVFEAYEEPDDPSAQVTPASSVHQGESQQPPEPDEGARYKENNPGAGAAPGPVVLPTGEAVTTTTEDPEEEATPPLLRTGDRDVKKPDQIDHPLPAAAQPDTRHQQTQQAPSAPDPEQQHEHQAVTLAPKDERWVISSMRRPQQLPIRAQNARLSTVSPTPTPPIATPPFAASTPASAPSTLPLSHKFHRPNAPVKIEIPEKPPVVRNSSAPAETFPRRRDSLRRHGVDSSGNMNGKLTKNIKYSSGIDYMENDPYGMISMAGRDKHPAERFSPPTPAATTSTTGKKNALSSFMKNIRKAENNTNNGTGNKDTKRFSMNLFASSSNKKDASNPMSLDEVFEYSEMVSNSTSQTHYTPPHSSLQLEDGSHVIEYVRAMWSFDARIPNEMNFIEGDTMAVLHKQEDGWWIVELMDPTRRQRGLVPGNYMQSKKG